MSDPITKIEKVERVPHTPGPWYAVDNGIYLVIRDEEFQIGDACGSLFYDGHDGNNALCEANARLMAAAPSLFAHAEKSLSWLVGERACLYEGHRNPVSGDVPDAEVRDLLDVLDNDIDELRALIAAAKGKHERPKATTDLRLLWQ